jgi:hypothetical protein
MAGCPGRDLINWTPDDIFDVACRECGAPVEFFKDDKRRRCASCGAVMFNPRITRTCADWCASADKCSMSRDGLGPLVAPPADEGAKTKEPSLA